MVRNVAREVIDGEDCARIPLGRRGKYGSCVMSWDCWERYLSDNHSDSLRVIGNTVWNGANESVAKIIMQAGVNEKVEYRNGNRKDLRLNNLVIAAGKSGPRIPPKPKLVRQQILRIEIPLEIAEEEAASDGRVKNVKIDLTPANDQGERLDKWKLKMKRRGHQLRESGVASHELFLIGEEARLNFLESANNNKAKRYRRFAGK